MGGGSNKILVGWLLVWRSRLRFCKETVYLTAAGNLASKGIVRV